MPTAKLFLISIVLVLMCALQASAQTGRPANDQVSGLYQGLAKMPAGSKDIDFVIEIKNENGALSGHADVEGGQLPLTGSYSRGAVTIKLNVGEELTISAKLNGDRIIGTWEMAGGRTGAIEMKRVSLGWKQVHDMIAHARADMSQFTKGSGKPGDANNPAKKWADQLLDYSRQHHGASESKDAENEGLLLLLRAGMIADAAQRAASLESPDDAWQRAVLDQLATADGDSDHDYAIVNADSLAEHSKRRELKAQIRLAEGDAYWGKGDPSHAKTLFQRVVDENPKTRFAEEARGNIYEIEKLNVGQPAPVLNSQFVDGHQARLADYKGKTVLLVFWASW